MRLFLLTSSTIILIFLVSCQSTVRFADNTGSRPGSTSSSSYNSRKTSSSSGNSIKFSKLEFERELAKVNSTRRKIVEIAETWLGVPYVWGGESKSGADCSGFVQSVFNEVNISLPRTASQQFEYAWRINRDDGLPGDLVFFSSGSGISHVGIYIGAGFVIHASTSRGVVRESLDESYLKNMYVGFCRVSIN